MKNKIFLTGGSGGIGSKLKQHLEQLNYNVIAPSRAELDLSNNKSIQTYFENNSPNFDILINNAGINILSEFSNYSDSTLDLMLQINIKAPMQLIRYALPYMRQQEFGQIINLASIYSIVTQRQRSIYSATKAAIAHLSRTIALEEGKYGILVNSISPGFINTKLTEQNNSTEQIAQLVKNIPLNRLGTTTEIAELVSFLISEKNTYITGQNIVIDGGYTLI